MKHNTFTYYENIIYGIFIRPPPLPPKNTNKQENKDKL